VRVDGPKALLEHIGNAMLRLGFAARWDVAKPSRQWVFASGQWE
jgi:hypothetical protein